MTQIKRSAGRCTVVGEARVLNSSLPIFLLLVSATVTWRTKVYYSGGLDGVVAAKGALSVLGLVLAWAARLRTNRPLRMGTRTIWFMVAYLTIATFGGWIADQLIASAVLSVRVLLLGATTALLVRTYPGEQLIRGLLGAMALVGLLGAVAGIPTVLAGERLRGTVPPLNPNEIAMLCGLPAIGILWLVLRGRARFWQRMILVVLLSAIWATGSRTGLIALAVGGGVMLLQVRRLKPSVMVTLVAAVPLLAYIAAGTGLFTAYFSRGGAENLLTFNARTIAWSAALDFPRSEWQRWLGSGLVQKKIPVEGQYWNVQGLDSSWVSALVQAGVLGVVLFAVWALAALVSAMRASPGPRMFFTASLAYLLVRSFLESGLLDSTPTFLMFLLVSLLADKVTRTSHQYTPSWRDPAGTPILAARPVGTG